MSKTIVIVGNGEPGRDVSKTVDAADEIIRFGGMAHYGDGTVGRRTTALVVRARYLQVYVPLSCPHLPATLKAGAVIWVVDDLSPGYSAVDRCEAQLATMNMAIASQHRPTVWDRRQLQADDKLRSEMRRHPAMRHAPYEVVGKHTQLALRRAVSEFCGRPMIPTVGMLITAFVLAHAHYCGWTVALAGFPMKFYAGNVKRPTRKRLSGLCHSVAWEQQMLDRWVEEGRIQWLESGTGKGWTNICQRP